MTNQNNPKNPFNENEDWQYWFNLDPDFVSKKKQSLNYFFKTHNITSSFFMSIKTQFSKLFHILTANAIVATISLILIGGTIGVSAAELLAPSEFKPSNFIKKYSQNQQQQKDPFTALSPDNDNFVVSIPDCNLAVKYPKRIGNLKTSTDVSTFTSSLNISETEYFNSLLDFRIGTEQNLENQNQKTSDIGVSCYKKSDYDRLPKRTDIKNQLTKEQFFAETGWFIFEADIKNFEDISYAPYESIIDKKYSNLLDRLVKFEFQDLVYEIGYTPRSLTASDFDTKDSQLLEQFKKQGGLDIPGIFGNQVQLQFNSIVTNTFSEDILATSSSSSSSAVSNNPKITSYLPKELSSLSVEIKNIQQAFKVIDGKTYWIQEIIGEKSCNQEGDPGNCGNYKLMTLESGKPKTILEFLKDSDLLSLQFLSSQSVDGQLYIYSCSGFGGGCRVDPGVLFNPKNGKITKDDKWQTSDSFGVWSKGSIANKIVAKDYPLYSSKKAWPTEFANEKYFGIKDGLQYGRVIRTVEFKEGDEPIGGEHWIVANNGKELTYLYKTELGGSNYEGIYLDQLKINSRGNLVNTAEYNSYTDAKGKTILIKNYSFIEQDLNTGKVIQKTEKVLEKDKLITAKKYE